MFATTPGAQEPAGPEDRQRSLCRGAPAREPARARSGDGVSRVQGFVASALGFTRKGDVDERHNLVKRKDDLRSEKWLILIFIPCFLNLCCGPSTAGSQGMKGPTWQGTGCT